MLYQFFLTASDEMFICPSQKLDYFSSVPNLLDKGTALAYTN